MASCPGLYRWIWRGSRSCGDCGTDTHDVQANHSTLYPTRTVVAWKKASYPEPLRASGIDRRNEDSAEIRVSSFKGSISREPSKGNSGHCSDSFKTRWTFNVTVPFYFMGLVLLLWGVHSAEQLVVFRRSLFTRIFTSQPYCSFL